MMTCICALLLCRVSLLKQEPDAAPDDPCLLFSYQGFGTLELVVKLSKLATRKSNYFLAVQASRPAVDLGAAGEGAVSGPDGRAGGGGAASKGAVRVVQSSFTALDLSATGGYVLFNEVRCSFRSSELCCIGNIELGWDGRCGLGC